jgi:hypothetical protein
MKVWNHVGVASSFIISSSMKQHAMHWTLESPHRLCSILGAAPASGQATLRRGRHLPQQCISLLSHRLVAPSFFSAHAAGCARAGAGAGEHPRCHAAPGGRRGTGHEHVDAHGSADRGWLGLKVFDWDDAGCIEDNNRSVACNGWHCCYCCRYCCTLHASCQGR